MIYSWPNKVIAKKLRRGHQAGDSKEYGLNTICAQRLKTIKNGWHISIVPKRPEEMENQRVDSQAANKLALNVSYINNMPIYGSFAVRTMLGSRFYCKIISRKLYSGFFR